MKILNNILSILESNQSLLKAVEALTIPQLIDLGEYCVVGDSLDQLKAAKDKSIDEVTTADSGVGNTVVVASIEYFYRTNRYVAHITFDEVNGQPEAIDVVVEKDSNWAKR